MAELPQFIFLKFTFYDRYITLSEQDEGTSNSWHLQVQFEFDMSEYLDFLPKKEKKYHMFEVEKARTVPGHVHIRTPYTNKYLVRESAESDLIVAEANEPEEDQSKWSCTLFKPVFVDADDVFSSQKITLFHVSDQSCERPISHDSKNNKFRLLEVEVAVREVLSFLTVVDAEARLPEYVAFLGPNKRYLVSEKDLGGMVFKSDEIGDKGVAQRICYSSSNNSGVMKIMDRDTGSYWTINQNNDCVVLGPQEEATSFSAFMFDNCIVIKCMSGPAANKFATSTSDDGVLKFDADAIVENAKLWAEEPVLVREVSDITYELKEYTVKPISKYELTSWRHWMNQGDVEEKGTFQVDYKESKTMSWSRSNTTNLGIKCNLTAGIPAIGKFGYLECQYTEKLSLEWGEKETKEKSVRREHEVMIPLRKRVTLEVVAKRAEIVLPFSCDVHDVMSWGESNRYRVTDGQYKSYYEFGFDDKITYLSDDDEPAVY